MNTDITLGLVRHLLTTAGGVLVTKGLLTTATLDSTVGAVLTIIGVVWSVFAKKKKADDSKTE